MIWKNSDGKNCVINENKNLSQTTVSARPKSGIRKTVI